MAAELRCPNEPGYVLTDFSLQGIEPQPTFPHPILEIAIL